MRKKSHKQQHELPGVQRRRGGYEINSNVPNYTYMPGGQPLAIGDMKAKRNGMPELEPPKQKRNWKKFFKRTALFLLCIVVLWGGWVGWKFLSNEAKIFGWKGLLGMFQHVKLKGEDTGRVNILLAGNSADDPGHGGANLTDSIMILSINTNNHTGYMLSIPRDLYVNIPGHDYAKINEAFPDGENDHFSESGYANGGMGLLEKTISEHFNVTLNYYALVDYTALKNAVNAVGGISVNIQSSDPRGLYDPSPDLQTGQPLVNLTNGVHTLNGTQALDLSRARGDSYYSYGYGQSDFERTKNQRMILLAIKDKATSAGTLSNPIKLGELFDSFGNNVKTDMTLPEARRFYTVLKQVPNGKIASASFNAADTNGQKDVNLLASYVNRYGQDTLIPKAGIDDYSQLQAYIQQLNND
jgi:LCP family protein required for cell wall assembly